MAFISGGFGWPERVRAAADALATDLAGALPRVGGLVVEVDRERALVVISAHGVPSGRHDAVWVLARHVAAAWPQLLGTGDDVGLRVTVDGLTVTTTSEAMWALSGGEVSSGAWWRLVAVRIG